MSARMCVSVPRSVSMQRAVIDVVEGMTPSSVYVDHDEQGRPRVVHLECAPLRLQARIVDEDDGGEGDASDEGGSVVRAVQEEVDRRAAISRCLITIREAVTIYDDVARESVTDRIATEGGALSAIRARAREADRERRKGEAWETIEDALLRLIGGAS